MSDTGARRSRDAYGTAGSANDGTASQTASTRSVGEAQPLLLSDGGGDDSGASTLTVQKAPDHLLGIDLGGGGRRPLVVCGLARRGAAARAGADQYLGWMLTHVGGRAVKSVSDVRQAGKGLAEVVLRFVPPPRRPSEAEVLEKIRMEESSDEEDEHPRIVEPPRNTADAEESRSQGSPGGARNSKRRSRSPRAPGPDRLARRYSGHTTALVVPVSAAMLGVVYSVQVVGRAGNSDSSGTSFISVGSGDTSESSSGDRFGSAALNALIITGLIVTVTFLFVCFYKMRWMNLILGWLILSSALVLWGIGMVWFDQLCVRYQLPIDWLTMMVIMMNFTAVGLSCIYYRGHPYMTRCYHIATSVVMAWFLTRLPEWTTWILLAAVAFYDIFAVFCGPLKVLVEESQARNEPIPALVYESRKYKLGLGDFIFYSVLVGRAAIYAYIPWVVCFVAILAGLCGTLFGLGVFRRALPALPLSIFIGIVFYFLSRYLMTPWAVSALIDGICV